jgi:hypothetical protein
LLVNLTKKVALDRRPTFLKKNRSSSAPQVLAFSVISGDEAQSFFRQPKSYYWKAVLPNEKSRGPAPQEVDQGGEQRNKYRFHAGNATWPLTEKSTKPTCTKFLVGTGLSPDNAAVEARANQWSVWGIGGALADSGRGATTFLKDPPRIGVIAYARGTKQHNAPLRGRLYDFARIIPGIVIGSYQGDFDHRAHPVSLVSLVGDPGKVVSVHLIKLHGPVALGN